MTLRQQSFSTTCFLIAFGIINVFALTLLLASLSFILGGRITLFHLPLAIGLAIFINYLAATHFLKEKAWDLFIKTNLFIVGIIIVSILFVTPFYDISIDGQWYHQETVYQMAKGWNPFYHELLHDSIKDGSLWFNHYAKGIETFQAAIYILTGKIETAKASGFILGIGSFFLCLSFLSSLQKFSRLKSIWISLLLALNPLVIVQLLTFCLDGQMASLLLYMILAGGFLFLDFNRYYLTLLGSAIIIVLNIKFTGILYAGILVPGILLILFIRKKAAFRPAFLWSIVFGAAEIFLFRFNPYVTNTLRHGHPLYPLMGEHKVDIMTEEYPVSWRGMNRFEKLFNSLFTHTDDLNLSVDPNPEVPLKIPFTLNKTDIHNFVNPQVTMAGFGPFFSGILLIALVILALIIFKPYDKIKRNNLLLILLMFAVSILIMEEAWLARYVPQFWFIPLIIAIAAAFSTAGRIKFWENALYVMVSINICFALLSIPWNYVQTKLLKEQLEELKAMHQTIPVDFTWYRSNRLRLEEYHLPYQEMKLEGKVDNKILKSFYHSYAKYVLPADKP